VTAKVGYYFPMDDWMMSNLKDKDLEGHRDNDMGTFPAGHTRLSHGWHQKVTTNPQINCDPRNQALIGMADGIPIFKDKNSRGVVPIAMRQANLPDSLSKRFNHIHLAALYPCDYWIQDPATGALKRESHKPGNLGALLVVLTDDLLSWYDGKWAVDPSLAPEDPGRQFVLRAILLFWCGDYPGLGETTNFKHTGYHFCHWCKDVGEYSSSLQRMVIAAYRRYTSTHDVTAQASRILCIYNVCDKCNVTTFVCHTYTVFVAHPPNFQCKYGAYTKYLLKIWQMHHVLQYLH
jgi:hypothetical protein